MIQRILVPLDGSSLAEQALPSACWFAREAEASLLLVRAAGSFHDAEARHGAITSAVEYLRSLQERLAGEGVQTGAVVLPHDPVQATLFAAELPGADLVTMCAPEPSGLGRVLAGAVIESVLEQATIPVLVIPPSDKPSHRTAELFGKILVPLDGSSHAETALAYLQQTPLAARASVTLLRVVEPPPPLRQPLAVEFADTPLYVEAEAETDRERQDAERHLMHLGSTLLRDGSWQARVVLGDAVAEILETVRTEAIDLIVMATHARHGLARLIHGNVTAEILHRADVPMLILTGMPSASGTSIPDESALHAAAAGEPLSRGQSGESAAPA